MNDAEVIENNTHVTSTFYGFIKNDISSFQQEVKKPGRNTGARGESVNLEVFDKLAWRERKSDWED